VIIVPVILASARTGGTKNLGTLVIVNDGKGTPKRSNYEIKVIGKNKRVLRRARIEKWPRESRPVFDLVVEALKEAGYGD
jgi:hypothetical protein